MADEPQVFPIDGPVKPVGAPLTGDVVGGMVADDIPASMITASQKAAMATSSMLAQARAARKETAKIFDEVLANEAEAMKTHGARGLNPQLTYERLQQIYGAEHAAVVQDQRAAYERFNAATAGWTESTSTADYAAGIEKLNPVFAPIGPAFKTHVEMYDLAKKRATEMQTRAEAAAKNRGEEAEKDFTLRLLPDHLRPKGLMPLSVADVARERDNLTAAKLKQYTDSILSPTEHTNPEAYAGLVLAKDKVSPAEYDRMLFDALGAKQIKSNEFAQLRKDARGAKDETEQYIEHNLDPGIVKGAAQAVFRQAQSNAMYEYSLWKNSPEGQEADDATRTQKGLDIIRRHQNVSYKEMQNAIGISRYIGARDRDSIDPATVAPGGAAWKALQRDRDAGLLSGAQLVNESENLSNWATILKQRETSTKAQDDAARRAKPLSGEGRFKAPAATGPTSGR